MSTFLIQLSLYYQPVILVLAGILVLVVVAYVNWTTGVQARIVAWIQAKLYRNSQGSEVMAAAMFSTATGYALAIGLGFILIGAIYLSGFSF